MATSSEQYERRLQLIHAYGDAMCRPCPTCLSNEWAFIRPELAATEPPQRKKWGWLRFWRRSPTVNHQRDNREKRKRG